MPESKHTEWKTKIRWANFPVLESASFEKRKKTTFCPRCDFANTIQVDLTHVGACPMCGLKYSVVYEGEPSKEVSMGEDRELSGEELEHLEKVKTIDAFRKVIVHYTVQKAGLKRTLESITQEQTEVGQRAHELLNAHHEVSGHLRGCEGVIERLQAALDKVHARVVEKS
jgi:hypothetical protein